MKPNLDLLNHPFWKESDPSEMRLVRVSEAFPAALNPFANDGVVITAAGVPGEAPHSKWIVAREGILHGIERGLIDQSTTIYEATSGNTGDGMGKVCGALGLRFVAVMSIDVPQDKINGIRVLGKGTSLQLLCDSDETTVACARRLGAQVDSHNPNQYEGEWNPRAHFRYLAPQLWERQSVISLLFDPAGTMGTSMGLEMHVREQGLKTRIIPVVCAEEQEVPGARTLSSIQKDVRQPWETYFRAEDLESGRRHAALHLSFLTWSHVPQMLGPSFGLAYAGALHFLKKHKSAGTLDQFREADGKIHVVVFGPDDYRPYIGLYLGELNRKKVLSAKTPPVDLLAVLDL